jgi:tRNA threonylcarbamoyladenosine biosynthesis protein TsaB
MINTGLLKIDGSDKSITRIAYDYGDLSKKLDIPGQPKIQYVLAAIEKLFAENKLSLNNINSISVNTGPGSFTGIRVSIAIARTLALLLGISVNDVSPDTDIIPEYGENRFD